MIEIEAKVRKWGRSLGVVIPKEAVQKEGLKENQKITLRVGKPDSLLKDSFGAFKFSKPTAQMLKESDKELYND